VRRLHRFLTEVGPGFRLSYTDLLVLLLTAGVSWLLWSPIPQLAVGLVVVLAHFFLFCNVFRVPRKLELAWAGALVLNVGAWQLLDTFSWIRVLAVQLPITAIIVGVTIWRPDYHGVGWRLRRR
jgi:hypothetical protein